MSLAEAMGKSLRELDNDVPLEEYALWAAYHELKHKKAGGG